MAPEKLILHYCADYVRLGEHSPQQSVTRIATSSYPRCLISVIMGHVPFEARNHAIGISNHETRNDLGVLVTLHWGVNSG